MIQKAKSIYQLTIINIIKKQFNSQLNLNFLTNNVKGLQTSKKCVKIFEYFRNQVAPKGILFFFKKCIPQVTATGLVRDMIRTYSQMHHTDKYSPHSSFIWSVWLNA